MGLNINNNLSAINTNRQLLKANSGLKTTFAKMSSGLRINRAADDAAGLAIATGLNAALRRGGMEINNLQSGINYAQTADGGLEAQETAVQRIRELAVQASNGTLTDDQRAAINAEARQLTEQIGDIAQDTEFNEQNLLAQDTSVDVGVSGGVQVDVNASTPNTLGIDTINLNTQAGARAAITAADTALERIKDNRSNLGAQMNRMQSAIEERENTMVNTADAKSRILDLDYARAAIERTRNQILSQGGLSALLQGNVTTQNALRLLGR